MCDMYVKLLELCCEWLHNESVTNINKYFPSEITNHAICLMYGE